MADVVDSDEVGRLRRVYAEYDRTNRGATVWSPQNPGNRAIVAERRRASAQVLARHGLGPTAQVSVLEIGCGIGDFLADLLALGFSADALHAVDLLEPKVEVARRRFPDVDVQQANAEHLPFADATFDLVVLTTVVSSVFDPGMAQRVAAEAARVLRPRGAILWYDMRYDNPSNPNVRGVSREELARLFPRFALDLRSVTVLPMLVRRLGSRATSLYPLLAAVRPLRTHLIGLLTKPR